MTRAIKENAIEQTFEQQLQTACDIAPGTKILIAVSGGVDSMVLLALCQNAAHGLALKIGVFHLDHQYRGDASRADYQLVKDYCHRLDIPFYGYRRPVQAIAKANNQGFEAMARDLRYRLMAGVVAANQYQVVLTAHHQGDHVETLFLHLLRGSGLQGLTGIASRRGNLARPLLSLDKQALYQYANTHSIPYHEDQSNVDTEFKRNHLRHELLPFLQTHYGKGVIKTIAQTASLLSADNDFISQQVDLAAKVCFENSDKACFKQSESVLTLKLQDFNAYHVAIQRRLVFRIFDTFNSHHQDVTMQHVTALMGWFDQGATSSIQLFQGIHFEKRQNQIRIMSKRAYDAALIKSDYSLEFGEQTLLDWGIKVIVETLELKDGLIQTSENVAQEPFMTYQYPVYQDAELSEMPKFWLRQRRAGDVIQIHGEAGQHRLLKKIFNDFKLASDQKAAIPIIGVGNTILWVVGYLKASNHQPVQLTQPQKKAQCLIRIRVFSL